MLLNVCLPESPEIEAILFSSKNLNLKFSTEYKSRISLVLLVKSSLEESKSKIISAPTNEAGIFSSFLQREKQLGFRDLDKVCKLGEK